MKELKLSCYIFAQKLLISNLRQSALAAGTLGEGRHWVSPLIMPDGPTELDTPSSHVKWAKQESLTFQQ